MNSKIEYKTPSKDEISIDTQELVKIIEAQKKQGKQIVAVQGLGFVGVAVAGAVASAKDDNNESPFFVIGRDLISEKHYYKTALLREGRLPFETPDENLKVAIKEGVKKDKNLFFGLCDSLYSHADIILIDLPLDVEKKEGIEVNLNPFKAGIRSVAKNANPNALFIVETTVPIGMCKNIILPILDEEFKSRNLEFNEIKLVHAYERVMPGNRHLSSINNFRRTISYESTTAKEEALSFFSKVIDLENNPLATLPSFEHSEMAKILENSYRAMNIAFIHEWTVFAEQAGINLYDVVDSIRVRKGTHDNMRYPGFGVGGYCLTKDAYFAEWSINEIFKLDHSLDFTLRAMNVNKAMPKHTIDLLELALNEDLKGKSVLILGVTYIANVSDTRSSPSETCANVLKEKGAEVFAFDPYVKNWEEAPHVTMVDNVKEKIKDMDAVIFAVSHSEIKTFNSSLFSNVKKGFCVVDANNIIDDSFAKELKGLGVKVIGVGKGNWREANFHK